jgi:hypothetical protein
MKINMNRRGFLKGTGAVAASTVVAPTALAEFAPTVLANIGENYYVECVDLNGKPEKPNVQYYNRDSERFKAFNANRPDNWRFYWNLSREHMANNLGERVVEILEDNPENYIVSSSPGYHLAFVASMLSSDDEKYNGALVIDKVTLKENHKVWGLSL